MHIPHLYNQHTQKAEEQSRPPSVFGWEQATLGGGLLVIGCLFVYVGNGFPPRVWRELVIFLEGGEAGQPFLPVLFQSFLFLVGWLLLLLTSLHVLRPAPRWREHRGTTNAPHVPPHSAGGEQSGAGARRTGRQAGKNARIACPLDRIPTFPAHRESGQGGEGSVSPGLLTQLLASSREYTAPTVFCLRGAITPLALSSQKAAGALTGAFLCRPGRPDDAKKGSEEALLIASGLCHTPAGISPSALSPFTLFILADGRSDKYLQQTVSRICVQAMSHAVCNALVKNVPLPTADIESLPGKGIQHINRLLCQHNQKYSSASAATITAILIVGGIAYIACVGNHRAYLYRPQKGFKRLTQGRPTVTAPSQPGAPAVRESGEVDERSAAGGVLGRQAAVPVYMQQVSLQADDLLILCSHGFWKRVNQATFLQLMKDDIEAQQTAETQICRTLLNAAQAKEAGEPISILVARASLL